MRSDQTKDDWQMANYDAYMICTSPRSGSTLLCKLLSATGQAGQPASYFHRPSIVSWRASLGLQKISSHSPRDELEAIINAVRTKGRAGTDVFGLRMQRPSFDFFMQQLSVLHPAQRNDVARLEAVFGRILFVHLTRGDKVEQAVSYIKADQTGLWHMAPDGTELERLSAPQDPRYDGNAIAAKVAEMEAYDHAWQGWFDSQGIDPLRITYEDLSADPSAILRDLLKALGLHLKPAMDVVPEVAKLSDQINRDWVVRFRRDHGAA